MLVALLRLSARAGVLETKLRENRERFRSLYDRNPDPVATYDPQGRIVRGNAAAVALVGSSPEALIGQHFSEHIEPSSLPQVEAAFARAVRGEACETEGSFRRDGTSVDLMIMLSPVYLNGVLTGVHCIAKDMSAVRAAESALAHSHQRYRSIFEHHPDAVTTLDLQGRYVQVNAAFERITGYRAEEVLGAPFAKVVAPESLQSGRQHFQHVLAGNATEFLSVWIGKNGAKIDVQVKACPILVGTTVEGAYAFAKDITEQRRLEHLTNAQTERIRSLYMVAASTGTSADEQIHQTLRFGAESLGTDCAYLLRASGDTFFVRQALGDCGLRTGTEIPMNQAIARHVYGARHALTIDDATQEPWRSDPSQERAPWQSYIGANVSIDGLPWGAISFVGMHPRPEPFSSADVDFVQLMGALVGAAIQRDVQQRKLGELAFYDTLTGLPNRSLLDQHLAQAIEGAKRRGDMVAVHFMDLDGFKGINDMHGHAAGDELLRQVALRLKKSLRGGDTVARVGGDEFVVVQPDLNDRRFAEGLACRMIEALSEPYALHDGTKVSIGTSVGICLYPQDGSEAQMLLRCSDEAMYRVKESGKNAHCFYT